MALPRDLDVPRGDTIRRACLRALLASPLRAVAIGLVALAVCPGAGVAQSVYSLTGNTRTQIGQGFPYPATFAPAPVGRVAVTGGTVMQTAGPDPKAMTFPSGVLDFGPNPTTILINLSAVGPFQQYTALTVAGPAGGTAMFSAGGRSGPATFTWCPGLSFPATASTPPQCSTPQATTPSQPVASIRYQAGAHQFGGVSQQVVSGLANRALRAGGSYAPCHHALLGGSDLNCKAAFTYGARPGGVIGGALTGGNVHVSVPIPVPGNLRPVKVSGFGRVLSVASVGKALGTFPEDGVEKSYGGPWTTGKVTIRVPTAAQTFYLEGSDMRVDGVGSISLVAGGVSYRSLTQGAANRGWQNWVVGHVPVPVLSRAAWLLLAAVLVVSSILMLRRAVGPTP